mmetsp:Transcript_39857/g.78577  ORF Transcript_39857/g.78577 Transcript_39857/m.78577 type:complete len:100 (+) Transcript_39857:911-1210(+)
MLWLVRVQLSAHSLTHSVKGGSARVCSTKGGRGFGCTQRQKRIEELCVLRERGPSSWHSCGTVGIYLKECMGDRLVESSQENKNFFQIKRGGMRICVVR